MQSNRGGVMLRSKRKMRRRKILSMPEISLTPLIDTALTLLIIFMITAPMMQNSIKVTLPEGKAKEVEEHLKRLVVKIDKAGTFFLNESDTAISQAELIKNIRTWARNNKNETVFVQADKDVFYGVVVNLMDDIKVVGGVKYVALATKG